MDDINDIIADLAQGRMVIIMDDEERENEGDLLMAAEHVTPEAINFMARYGRGLICLTLSEQRCRQLQLPLMVSNNASGYGTNFTLSIDASESVTTGISAADRARTIQAAVARDAQPEHLTQPGHIFPLMAQAGGVLRRAGHTEAGCDLARLAGLEPAAVIVEILNADGSMARRPDLEIFAREHGLKIGTIADLIEYRVQNEQTVVRQASSSLTTEFGGFELLFYQDTVNHDQHMALVKGDIDPEQTTMVRVHIHNPLHDLAGVMRKDNSWGLHAALKQVADAGQGVVVILKNQVSDDAIMAQAGALDPEHCLGDVVSLDETKSMRTVGLGAQIIKDLGIRKMRVLGTPRKMPALSGFGLEIVEYVEAVARPGGTDSYTHLALGNAAEIAC